MNEQNLVPDFAPEGCASSVASSLAVTRAMGRWQITCRDKHGRVKWVDYVENLVTTAGLNKYLDATLKTGLTTPAWYLGLTDGMPTVAAGDTMASHAGWTEVAAYDEAARQAWTPGTIAAGSVDNLAAPATFTISINGTTVGGVFIVDNSTKSGTTGTLLAVGAFTAGDKSLDDNDKLEVTLTATQAAA